ncbi:fimbrillin MatB [Serratia odorifera DSM 4582]|uniref:Common pilus major fimbrillin subunit EcpA n=2 Tax=Serratia odorifera TaxID=618 RepID=D4E8Y9_SEROD|nr:fimbrillin MatB [Serratia odorifera DSM 4582]
MTQHVTSKDERERIQHLREFYHEKMTLALAIVSAFVAVNAAQAADVTAQALATWSATAKKDTSSKLVVTPIGSLTFQYAEGIKGFNSQKGLFDVTVEGDATATAFKLTSKLVSNTLTQLDTSGSTLDVGVNYNGTEVVKTAETTMIDTANGILGGNLSALSNGYNVASRSSAQDQFTFSIIGATTDGTTAVTDYSTLPEGIWSGDVSVEFNATWTI